MCTTVAMLAATLATGSWGTSEFSLAADGEEVRIKAKSSANALEFYLVPDGGEFEYYVFRVDAKGGRSARFFSEFGAIEPEPYGPIWKSDVRPGDGGAWSASLRIPITAFDMTRAGVWKETWKVNAVAFANGVATAWAGGTKPEGNELRTFLKTFRAVGGFPKRPAADDVHVKSATAVVTGLKGGKPCGRIKLHVICPWAGAFSFSTSWSGEAKGRVPFGGGELVTDAVFPGAGRQMTQIRLVRPDGKVFAREYPLYVDFEPIRVKLTKPQYRNNFYPGQDASAVEGTVTSFGGEPVELTLDGPGFGHRCITLEKSGAFRFDTSGFANGDAVLTVRSGKASAVKKIRKLAPLPQGRPMAWIENGNLVVNGRPTARRNIYADGFNGGAAFDERYRATDLHQTTNTHGIANLDLRNFDRRIYTTETKFDQRPSQRVYDWLDTQIARAEKSAGISYYITDEPECSGMSAIYLRHIYEYLAEKDPYHVVNCCSRAGETYIDIADWFETHPYINPHVGSGGRRVYRLGFSELGSYVDAFRPEAHPDKCIGGTPTCFAYTGNDYPTFDEYVLNYWCELVRGAKTMLPYAYHDLGDRPALFEGTRYMFESMESLEDVLLFGRRETLAKTAAYECARWTMPEGDRVFALLNFTQEPISADVPGLSGTYREFRGRRVFRNPRSFRLAPHESLVACERARDKGLRTLAEVRREIEEFERARTQRDNQLLGRHEDIDIVTSTGRRGAWWDDAVKVFDGTLDVVAWREGWNKDKFFEMAFPKFIPQFSAVSLYGRNIEGYGIKIRDGGEWKVLEPVSTEKSGDRLSYRFDRTYSTVKMRITFPRPKVELYEIELPGRAREIAATATNSQHAGLHWTISTPEFSTNMAWTVSLPLKPSFLVFRLGTVPLVKDNGYTNWTLVLNGYGMLLTSIRGVLPGLYTLRLPARRPGSADPTLMLYDHNLIFGMGDIICCDLPADCAELVETDGMYRVRVKLSSSCEDMTCSLFEDAGLGPHPFMLKGGMSSIDLRPVNDARTLWEGRGCAQETADKKRKPFPFAKVTTLGGTLSEPIFTWLAR